MKTNLIYAIRNIIKNKTNSIISVVGLAIAIACCLWIYFFVSQENSYNRFFPNADRIFRVNYELKFVDGTDQEVRVEPEIADLLTQKVPQIEKSTEYRFAFTQLSKHGNEFFDTEMSYADKEFFEIFSLYFLAGDREEIFKNIDEIVITREFADKILRQEKKDYSRLIGQSIEFPLRYDGRQFQISGVIENLPENTSFYKFEGIIPGDNGRNFGGCDNELGYTSVFYLTKENASIKDAEKNTIAQLYEYYDARIQGMKNRNTLINSNTAFTPFILSISAGYFENQINNCNEFASSRKNSIILISIGVLILLIACVNYTLLSLGQALKKICEVGVRKAMGARTGNIFSLFFSEGIVLTLIAFISGAFLCTFFLKNVDRIAQIEIYSEIINIGGAIVFSVLSFLGIVLFTSVLPVLIFSSITPRQLTGNKLSIGKKGLWSQLFVSFQYSLSIILIIVTISIIRQSNYMKNKSLGFSAENIIDLDINWVDPDQKLLLRELLAEHPGVINQTMVARNFDNGNSNNYVDKGNGEQILVYRFKVDEKFIPTLDLDLIHGKNFSLENLRPNDRAMIVNQTFVEVFGIEDNPIGKTYRFGGSEFSIIGVIDDFFFRSLKREHKPAMLFTRANWGNGYFRMLIKTRPDQLSEAMDHVKESYRKVAPGKTFTYQFWDEELGQRYQEEERWGKIVGLASVIAILISSLGLFGLTILLINQRIKEIGVRKVNGARSTDVLITINKTFISWLMASIAIATPVAYAIVRAWLQNFPYKAGNGWWVFILSGSIALVIALITVSWQSWKAARMNPVKALRYE